MEINKSLNVESFKKYIKEESEIQSLIYYFKSMNYEELAKEQEEHLEALKDTCHHDIVLRLGVETLGGPNVGKAVCLMCGRKLYLEDNQVEISPEGLINADGIINPKYITTFVDEESILVSRASAKLAQLIYTNASNLPLEEISATILEDLVYYTDELEDREVKPRKRARKISERK